MYLDCASLLAMSSERMRLARWSRLRRRQGRRPDSD